MSKLKFETLEEKKLLTVSAYFHGDAGILHVWGDVGHNAQSCASQAPACDDVIRVEFSDFPNTETQVFEYIEDDDSWALVEIMGDDPAPLPEQIQTIIIEGGYGNDTIDFKGITSANGYSLDTSIEGGPGNDVLEGTEFSDDIQGGNGNDRLYGLGGDDELRGDAGHDIIYGNDGNDDLYGDIGGDLLFGGSGDDLLDAGIDGNHDQGYGGAGLDMGINFVAPDAFFQ